MKKHRLLFLWLSLLLCAVGARATEVRIGEGTATNSYLPTNVYYGYSLSQQIYTADEIGMAGTINSVAFTCNTGETRTLDIYLVATDKASFADNNEWVTVTAEDKVFSGSVNFISNAWTTIEFDKSFVYDGKSNVVLVVDDNSNSWKSSITFLSFNATNQAIYKYNDTTNYDPLVATTGGTVASAKNQVVFDITTGDVPPCDKPTGLTVDGITTNSAVISWTSDASAFNLEYKLQTDENWINVDNPSSPYTLSGLTPGKTYQVRVRTDCGDSQSGWTTTSFTTSFGIPFSEEFAGTSIPTGWKMYTGLLENVLAGTATLNTASSGWAFGTGNGVFDSHVRVNIYGTSCQKWLVTPVMNVDIDTQLSFDVAYTAYSGTGAAAQTTGADDKFTVLISTDEGATWTILRQWDNAGSEYVLNNIATTGESVAIDLAAYTGQSICVAFYAESTASNADNNLHIDNVLIDEPPSCAKPTGLAVSDVTNVGATFTWDVVEGTQYNLRYIGAEDTDYTVVEGVTSPFALNTLDAGMIYEVQVQTDCGDSQSEWSKAVNFTTELCAPEDQCEISYELTDSYGDGWNGNAISIVDKETGVQVANLTIASGGSASGSVALCNGRTYTFKWVSGSYSNECSYVFLDVNGEEIISGSDVLADKDYTMDCTVNSCKTPKNVTVTTVGPNSATLSWTADEEQSAWEIVYSTDAEFDPDTATPVAADSNPFELTGLDVETTYYAYVRGVCSSDSHSKWSDVVTFTTTEACPAPTDLAVDPQHNSATISWTGYSESYILQYRPSAKGEVSFADDFENGLDNWTVLINGGGNGWRITDASQFTDGSNHSGNAVVMTRSWEGNATGGVNADNWLISPMVDLGGTLEYWARGDGTEEYSETYSILVSTRGTDPNDFENIITFSTNPATWEKVTVDLSAYEGEGYIAFHHEDYDKDLLWIDDVKIYGPSDKEEEWITMTTEETSVEITGLEIGTDYEYQVQGVCDGTPGTLSAINTFTTLDESTKIFVSDGFWDEDDNWFPVGVPTGTEDVIVRAIASIPVGFLAKAKTVTIEEGGSITIQDGGQLKQGSDNLEVTLEKIIIGYGENEGGYNLIGTVDIDGTASADVEGLLEGTFGYYQFDSTQPLEWRSYDSEAFDMAGFKGYLYANQNDQTLKLTGTTGSSNLGYGSFMPYPISDSATNDDYNGWSLISNPYPCNVEVLSLLNYNNQWYLGGGMFYKLNANGDGYDIYEGNTALAPGEAAFIKIVPDGYSYYVGFMTEEYSTDNGEGVDVELADYTPIGSTMFPFLPKHDVTGDQDANLPLEDASYDNSTILADLNTEAAPVVLNGRTLYRDTKWNTICLPFNVTLEGSILEGAIVKPLADATVTDKHVSLIFGDAVDAIEAGVPYIIKWEEAGEDIVNPSFGWVTIQGDEPVSLDFASGQVKFIGYYDAFDITADDSDIWYMKSDNTLTHTAKPRTLKAVRTYFQLSEELSSGVNSFSIDFGDGETSTGITEIADSSAPEGYFNLQGVKFDNAPKQKGVYIVNGKKVVVK